MNASRAPLIVGAMILAFGAGCSTSNNGSITTGVAVDGNATGHAGGNATGTNGGSPTSGGANGTSTGEPPQDPIGTVCSKKGNAEYQSCSTSLDCACPLLCGLDATRGVDDAGGSICVHPCSSTANCPEIFTSCQNGLCSINICEADGGGGAFFGPCDAAGTNDGTCEPTVTHDDEVIGTCIQSGTVDVDGGNCDPNQSPFIPLPLMVENLQRPSASSLCPIGYACVGTGMTTGYCQQLCDPVNDRLSDNDAGGCLGGKDCVPLGNNTQYGGACTFQGDGGCLVGGGLGELATCAGSTQCECPLECEIDAPSLRHGCEVACTQTLPGDGGVGCDVPYTSCQRVLGGGDQTYCNYNYCVQTYFGEPAQWLPDAGSYTGPCNRAAVGDGICQPEYSTDQFGNPIAPFGYCEPAGAVPLGGACENPPYCGQNELCVGPQGGPYNCVEFCQPFLDGGNGGCKTATDGCFTVIPPPLEQVAGFCAACTTPTNGCYNSPECCDGYCAYAQPDAGNGFCN